MIFVIWKCLRFEIGNDKRKKNKWTDSLEVFVTKQQLENVIEMVNYNFVILYMIGLDCFMNISLHRTRSKCLKCVNTIIIADNYNLRSFQFVFGFGIKKNNSLFICNISW